MIYKKEYSGEIYGDLTVLHFSHRKGSHSYWICQCKCGELVKRIPTQLKSNVNNGCPNCVGKKGKTWKGKGDLPHDYFNSIRQSALAKNFEFCITIEEIWSLFLRQEKRCALTNREINFHKTFSRKKEKTASLDRIDSERGYSIDNVQWVHRDVNWLKRSMPNDKFISLCKEVANFSQDQS